MVDGTMKYSLLLSRSLLLIPALLLSLGRDLIQLLLLLLWQTLPNMMSTREAVWPGWDSLKMYFMIHFERTEIPLLVWPQISHPHISPMGQGSCQSLLHLHL